MAPMEKTLKTMISHRWLNAWGLFFILSIPMSLMMVYETLQVDVQTAAGVSAMIGYSVRVGVPFIFVVAATSALQKLFPSIYTAWLLRNRKYVGLCFAVAMAWQALFIAIMSIWFNDYYYEEVYLLRNELEGSTGYIFITFMTLTSFQFVKQTMSRKQWKILHLTGLYALWAYPFAVYWWNLFYYEDPALIDYIYYWMGFLAFSLRIAAWGKMRRQRATLETPPLNKFAGGVLMVIAVVLGATGLQWQDPVTTYLTNPAWSAELYLWLPYWPFEPFFPLMVLGLGTYIFTLSLTEAKPAHV